MQVEVDMEGQAICLLLCKSTVSRLATAKPTASHPRVAREGEAAPKGHKRVPFSAIVDD